MWILLIFDLVIIFSPKIRVLRRCNVGDSEYCAFKILEKKVEKVHVEVVRFVMFVRKEES